MRDSGKPTTINGTLVEANTEYEISLPLNCHKIMFQTRTSAIIQFAFVANESGTNYITLKAGNLYYDDNIRTNSKVYVQSPTAGVVMEVLCWSGGSDDI